LSHCTVQGEDIAVWLAESGWAFRSEIVSAKRSARHQPEHRRRSLGFCRGSGGR
jgi:hypothetical protein